MSLLLHNVCFFYPSAAAKQVLDIEQWSVTAKKKHFVYGPSGSGKSTLLNLISGLLVPQSGTVEVLGETISQLSTAKRDQFRANNIGYIFQQFNLIPYLNAIENITLAHNFANKKQRLLLPRIHFLLESLQVNHQDWQRPVNQLSIGQQQRIGIARAFINQPQLLIADEPTSALDSDARDRFIALLTPLCKEYKSTLLFVSHDTQLTPHFDEVHALANFNRVAKQPLSEPKCLLS